MHMLVVQSKATYFIFVVYTDATVFTRCRLYKDSMYTTKENSMYISVKEGWL